MNDRPSIQASQATALRISRFPYLLLIMLASLLLVGGVYALATPQQAQAADYPAKDQLYFEFENFGNDSRPHVVSYAEYCDRTGWRTVDGVLTYREEWVRETGIFYTKSNGTLTIDGYDSTATSGFGKINRIFVGPGRAVNLTVIINDDWTSNQSAIRWLSREQYVSTHGAIIANDSGGSLTIASNNGSEVHLVSSKSNINQQYYNPIGIYCAGTVDICGSIDLHVSASNANNADTPVDSEGHGYNYAWGIWAGQKVLIRDSAQTNIYASASLNNTAPISSAIYAGDSSGRPEPVIRITSTGEQSFRADTGNNPRMAVFTFRSLNNVANADETIYFKSENNASGDPVGTSSKITCRWPKNSGYFVSAYNGVTTKNPMEKSGYILIRDETEGGTEGNATYYSAEGRYIIRPEVRHTMPRIGQPPSAAADFTLVTPGLKLEDAYYEITPARYSDGSWVPVGPGSSGGDYIPTDAKALRVIFTLGAQNGYEIAKPYRSELGSTRYTICDFNGQEVRSSVNINYLSDTTVTFIVELDVDDLIPANFVQYVSVSGVTAPKPDVRVPRALTSGQVTGNEDVVLPAGDTINYELANIAQNASQLPESLRLREWWTDSSGQVINRNQTDTTKFEANRTYTYHLLLQAKDGYVFGGGRYDDISELHTFINGYPALSLDDQYRYPEARQRYIHISRQFKCPPRSVDEVEVFDVPVPVIGGQARLGTTANPIGTVADGSVYRIKYDRWYQGLDYTSGMGVQGDNLTGAPFTSTFQANTWYTYQAELEPIDSTYAFNATTNGVVYSGITAHVNGSKCGTIIGDQYRNTVRFDPSTGILKVRYSFFVPAAAEDTVSNIELATPLFGLDHPNNVYHRANSLTEGVTAVAMENAPGYPSIATNSRLAALKGKTSIWLDGDSQLGQVYHQAVYGTTTATLTSQFRANGVYTFYSVVDLGSKSFAYDSDGNTTTKVTVNGIPAELYPGTRSGGVDNTHKALVKMVYTMPANTSSCWLIVPNKVRVKAHGANQTAVITNRSGFDWYNYDYTNDYTLNNVQSNASCWAPPAGEQFWKWVCTSENFVISAAYSRSVDIGANVIDGEDLVFDILTAPKGHVPIDISTRNGAIRINEWGNNWGGSSTSTTATYDGLAKKRWPVTIVNNAGTTSDTSDDYTLVLGKDFTVSYIDNAGNSVTDPTNVGTYKTVITGIGNYDGKREVSYNISSAEIGRAAVAFTGASYDYTLDPPRQWFYWTGAQQKPAFTVTFGGRTLTEGTDYTIVEWGANTNVGGGFVRIQGIGNFRSTFTPIFDIRAHDIGDAQVAEIPDETYTGTWHMPDPVITFDGETLVKDTHYSLNYSNNIDAGTSTITVMGRPEAGWTGVREVTFTILPVDLNDENVIFDPISLQYYTGEYITNPSIYGRYVVDGVTRHLYKSSEFEIVPGGFTNNLFPGEASLTIRGRDNYTGTRTLPFDIYYNMSGEKLVVSGIEESYTYTGEDIKPKPTAVYLNSNGHGAMTLSEGTGYTLTYEADTVNTGNKTMKVVPVDTEHFTYDRSIIYYIAQRNIADATVAPIADQTYIRDSITPAVTVTWNGKALPGSDYDVTINNNYNVGEATVRIDGYGNWTGQTTTTFNILPVNIGTSDQVSFEGSPAEYTGSEITSPALSGTFRGYTMYQGAGSDYTLKSFVNNVDPGTATVTVEGTGNFTGTRDVPFEIYADLNGSYMDYSGVAASYDSTGSQIKPEPTVKVGDKTLAKGTDYALEYGENLGAGTQGWVKVVPADTVHFINSRTFYFNIAACDLSTTTITVADQVFTGQALTPKPTVKTSAGVTLAEGTDYEITGYANNTDPGVATVSIAAVPGGNFTGTATANFNIVKPHTVKWDRIYGAIAADTMQKIAAKFGKSNYAIVTTDASFKDALAASSLAGHYKAPVLMTKKGSLTKQTKAAIQASGAKTVIVVGSTSDVTTATQNAIKKVPGVKSAWRVNGKSASEKAINVAKKTGTKSNTVIIVTQNDYRDALTIAPYAYATESPILYTETNKKLSTATLSYIKSRGFKQAIIIGGPLALPDSVDLQLRSKGGIKKANITRIAGTTAYDTSRLIAEWTTGNLKNGNHGTYKGNPLAYIKFQPAVKFGPNNVCVSTGQNWLDALAGAALCGKWKTVMLLADSKTAKSNSSHAINFLSKYKDKIDNAWVLGGPKAVQDGVYAKLQKSTEPLVYTTGG